jgi:hypothetical protein
LGLLSEEGQDRVHATGGKDSCEPLVGEKGDWMVSKLMIIISWDALIAWRELTSGGRSIGLVGCCKALGFILGGPEVIPAGQNIHGPAINTILQRYRTGGAGWCLRRKP